MMNIDLYNKVALVTGTGKGIGHAVAKMLAKAGCTVVGCSRANTISPDAQKFDQMLRNENAIGKYVQADVTNHTDLEGLVKEVMNTYGKIDILVSNAGQNVFKGAKNCTDKEWSFNIDLNLKSHWQLAQLCKPYLEKSGNGVIIIMTSNHAYYTIPGCFPYNVTKTALKGLVQSMSIEWGPTIRTVGVAPGFIDTEGNQDWFNSFPNPQKERQRTIEMHPVKKIGTPEEVGSLCAFLASENAGFISGTTILMDGGRSALMQDDIP